jgi:pimeloyl-ACP methyl ester carboxylesterase
VESLPAVAGDAEVRDGSVTAASITTAGGVVRYRRIERGAPATVLMLHGLGGDHRGLLEMAEALPDVNVVLPDLPGYGDSAPLSRPHTLANYAQAVEDVRVELGLGACHLVGHSLGASIALVHAAVHGGDIKSLCLLNPVSTASNLTAALGKAYYRVAAAMPAPVARFWLASKPAVFVADRFIIHTRDRARRKAILEQDYENYRRASIPAMIESFLSYYETPFDGHADAIAVPTLLVTGDKDRIAPVASVSGLADRMPAGRLAVLADAGHLVPMERPADVASLVGDFLSTAVSTVD